MRCEMDHKDGGVCLRPVCPINGTCPGESDHAGYAEWIQEKKLTNLVGHVSLMTENGWSRVLISEMSQYFNNPGYEDVNVYTVVQVFGHRRASVKMTDDVYVLQKRDGGRQWYSWTQGLTWQEIAEAKVRGYAEIDNGEWEELA